MSSGQHPGDPAGRGGPAPDGGYPASEEELRAAYEAEIKQLRVEQVLLEQVVTLVNLGMRRTGLAPGTEDERDAGQVRLAIDSVRALLPLLEATGSSQAGAIRDALSQLQLAFVRLGGAPGTGPAAPTGPDPAGGEPPAGAPQSQQTSTAVPGAPPEPDPAQPGDPGPAQRSGRLWIPGQ